MATCCFPQAIFVDGSPCVPPFHMLYRVREGVLALYCCCYGLRRTGWIALTMQASADAIKPSQQGKAPHAAISKDSRTSRKKCYLSRTSAYSKHTKNHNIQKHKSLRRKIRRTDTPPNATSAVPASMMDTYRVQNGLCSSINTRVLIER